MDYIIEEKERKVKKKKRRRVKYPDIFNEFENTLITLGKLRFLSETPLSAKLQNQPTQPTVLCTFYTKNN